MWCDVGGIMIRFVALFQHPRGPCNFHGFTFEITFTKEIYVLRKRTRD